MGVITVAWDILCGHNLRGVLYRLHQVADKMAATGLGAVMLNYQARTARESHWPPDTRPPFWSLVQVPTMWHTEPKRGVLRPWMCPEQRTVNREECGFSTFSSRQGNNNSNNNNNKKASSFICRNTSAHRKVELVYSHAADLQEEGMRPKTNPLCGSSKQKPQLAEPGREPHGSRSARRRARGRCSQNT